MGLFQQRPEEPTEWGGLPSEPWEPRGPVEQLDETAVSADLPLFGDIPARQTIAFSVALDPETAITAPPPLEDADDAD